MPSHSRPAEDLHCAVNQVKEIWAELGASPKHMLLSMIGVWNTQQRELLTAHRTDNEDDFMGPTVAGTMGQERLFFTSTQLHCAHTMLPFALQCRFAEALQTERVIRLMERLPRIIPLAARVDGIYWTAECLDSAIELHELAAEHRYDISRRPVYKMKECRMDKMPVNAQSFEYKGAPLHRMAPWTYRQELGAQEMLANGGALVTGAAGIGKAICCTSSRNWCQTPLCVHIRTRQQGS